jgi:glycosyltransferase involved in cell wall biosynthesis
MVVHAHYPLGETRVERQALALYEHGYQVDVICLRGSQDPSFEIVQGINVYRLPVRRKKSRGPLLQFVEYAAFFLLAFFKVTALHMKQRYQVVQVHNLPDFLVFVALIPKLTGARVILDLHDLMPEFYAGRFDSGLSSWPVRVLFWEERVSGWFADHVVTVTETWRQTLIQRHIPERKTSVVMNVADDHVFNPEVEPPATPRRNDRFTIVYHGNITPRYGIDLVIRAVDLVKDEIPQIHFVVHYPGTFETEDYRGSLPKLVQELKLEGHVTFSTQRLSSCELADFIRQADIGIVPYRRDVFTDGILPTKLMEYAALGIPAIAARTTAIRAYFDDTMVQFFAPDDVKDLAQCMTTLFHDRERLDQLTQGIRKFNQRYNWTTVGAEYVALVDRLAQH